MKKVFRIRNYWHGRNELYIDEHEVMCPDCKGLGIKAMLLLYEDPKRNITLDRKTLLRKMKKCKDKVTRLDVDHIDLLTLVFCNKCLGEGKIDWIKRIRGPKYY